MKKRYLFSILLNLLLLAILIVMGLRQRDELTHWYLRKTHSAQIAMLGDSHTEIPDWNLLLNRRDVWEVAKYGYTSELIQRILSSSIDAHSKPRYCFVLAGTNDALSREFDATFTLENDSLIAQTIQSKGVKPVFQTIPYLLNQSETNARIDTLNAGLKRFCQAQKIDLIDLNKLLATGNNLQKDGIHLNDKGYQVWAGAVNDFLTLH
ncbi:hypothetical protein GCM10027299_09400 [Larkinella ripae]